MVFLFLHQLVDEKASPARLLDMSNQFFTMIPHDFGMKKPPVLDRTEFIQVMCAWLRKFCPSTSLSAQIRERRTRHLTHSLSIVGTAKFRVRLLSRNMQEVYLVEMWYQIFVTWYTGILYATQLFPKIISVCVLDKWVEFTFIDNN